MSQADLLEATCDRCGEAVLLAADALLDLDPSCQACGEGLLVLHMDGPAPQPDFHDRPTKADAFVQPPGEDDPYEQAARALDRVVTEAVKRRDVPSARGAPSPASTPALLKGTPSEAPPLPSWDGGDTQQVEQLARVTPRHPMFAPLDIGEELRQAARMAQEAAAPAAPDDGVEVVEIPASGTHGRGSRAYERGQVLAEEAAEDEAEQASATERPGSKTSIDLDWLALTDDLGGDPDDSSASRVFIRMPEAAAPGAEASDTQRRIFQEALRRLEEGNPSSLSTVLQGSSGSATRAPEGATRAPEGAAPDSGDAAARDGEKTQAWPAGTRAPDEGEPAPPPAAKDETTRQLKTGANTEGDTRPWEREDDTREWSSGAREGTGRAAAPARRASSASSPALPAGPRQETLERHLLDPALVCARDLSCDEADLYRQLFQRVFGGGRRVRSVLVTSPRRGAGKTTVAANLALVAARYPGSGAVLVDADLRGGGVLRAFGLRSRAEGLLEALQSDEDPRRYAIGFNAGQLDVIPLGIPGSDAPELIGSERVGSALGRLKASAMSSVVILDGSSVLQAADPLVLARHVDGVILVARAGQTTREELAQSIEALGTERVLGVLLNGVSRA